MSRPEVSVVASVYNGARYLERSLRTVLEQKGPSLELIVVDDGSTDGTAAVLAGLERQDKRVRVLSQENRGLTQALVRASAEANGEYIARHDSDDLSLPGRLARQVAMLDDDPKLVLVSCRAEAIGPRGELLYEKRGDTDPAAATAALRAGARGPSGHGSVMFRAEAFRAVGGYRPDFRYAQDWDLWLRLVERGSFAFAPEVLYRYRVDPGSISAKRRKVQLEFADLALRCARAREQGADEGPLLEEARHLSAARQEKGAARSIAGLLFIASCLARRRDLRVVRYLGRAALQSPWEFAQVTGGWFRRRGLPVAGEAGVGGPS